MLHGPGFKSRQGQEFLRIVQIVTAAQPAGYRGSLPRFSSRGMMLTSHLHLVPSLRTSISLGLLPVNAFVAWIGINLLFKQTSDFIKICFRDSRVVVCVRTDGQIDFNRRSTEMRRLIIGVYRHKHAWCS